MISLHHGANVQANKRSHSFFKFAECPQRFVNSLVYREQWFESFFIQSLTWCMSTMLVEEQRAVFADFIKTKISKNVIIEEERHVYSHGSAGRGEDLRRFRSELSNDDLVTSRG